MSIRLTHQYVRAYLANCGLKSVSIRKRGAYLEVVCEGMEKATRLLNVVGFNAVLKIGGYTWSTHHWIEVFLEQENEKRVEGKGQ